MEQMNDTLTDIIEVETTTSVTPLAAAEIENRHAFRTYVLEQAEPWHRRHLGRLYADWERYNGEHFGGELAPPYILLAEPSNPRRYGDCGKVSGFGGKSQIRIRPSLLTGTHPDMDPAPSLAEGRYAFVSDVLLHEMIHQYHQEVTGTTDDGYNGHGPAFRDRCNIIGDRLGGGRVRTCKARGKDADLLSCSQWPHNVHTDPTYAGAYVHYSRLTHQAPPSDDQDETVIVPADPDGHARAIVRLYSVADARHIAEVIMRMVDDGESVCRVQSSVDACREHAA